MSILYQNGPQTFTRCNGRLSGAPRRTTALEGAPFARGSPLRTRDAARIPSSDSWNPGYFPRFRDPGHSSRQCVRRDSLLVDWQTRSHEKSYSVDESSSVSKSEETPHHDWHLPVVGTKEDGFRSQELRSPTPSHLTRFRRSFVHRTRMAAASCTEAPLAVELTQTSPGSCPQHQRTPTALTYLRLPDARPG